MKDLILFSIVSCFIFTMIFAVGFGLYSVISLASGDLSFSVCAVAIGSFSFAYVILEKLNESR